MMMMMNGADGGECICLVERLANADAATASQGASFSRARAPLPPLLPAKSWGRSRGYDSRGAARSLSFARSVQLTQ